MFLDGEREVRAALHRCVVRDDHALAALDDADAGHDARSRRLPVVEIPGCERVQLEEGCARVDEAVDALACRQLSPGPVTLRCLVATALGDQGCPLTQLADEALHPVSPPLEGLVSFNG